MNTIQQKINWKHILVGAIGLMIAFAWLAPIDSVATDRVDTSLKRALLSYGTARALNAVISVAQGTEVTVQLGLGVNLAPGQLLDPLNDLVEQLSQVLLIASVSLGVQKILLAIGGNWIISILLTITGLGWCTLRMLDRSIPCWLTKLLAILLLVRFVLPLALIGTDLLYQSFIEPTYRTSQTGIETASSELEKSSSISEAAKTTEVQVAKPSLFGQLMGKLHADPNKDKEATVVSTTDDSANHTTPQTSNPEEKRGFLDKINPKKKLEEFKQSAEKSIDHMIQLIVVFILDTIILPILFIWGIISIARGGAAIPRELRTIK